MSEWLATYNFVLLQVFIAAVLVVVTVTMLIKTAFYMVNSYQRAKLLYRQYKKGNLNILRTVLKKQKKTKVGKKRTNYVVVIFITVLVAALVFIGLAWLAHEYMGMTMSTDHVVITFVGIIATFIVVTNYAQVSDIKNELNEKIAQLDARLKYVSKKMEDLGREENDNNAQ